LEEIRKNQEIEKKRWGRKGRRGLRGREEKKGGLDMPHDNSKSMESARRADQLWGGKWSRLWGRGKGKLQVRGGAGPREKGAPKWTTGGGGKKYLVVVRWLQGAIERNSLPGGPQGSREQLRKTTTNVLGGKKRISGRKKATE